MSRSGANVETQFGEGPSDAGGVARLVEVNASDVGRCEEEPTDGRTRRPE